MTYFDDVKYNISLMPYVASDSPVFDNLMSNTGQLSAYVDFWYKCYRDFLVALCSDQVHTKNTCQSRQVFFVWT